MIFCSRLLRFVKSLWLPFWPDGTKDTQLLHSARQCLELLIIQSLLCCFVKFLLHNFKWVYCVRTAERFSHRKVIITDSIVPLTMPVSHRNDHQGKTKMSILLIWHCTMQRFLYWWLKWDLFITKQLVQRIINWNPCGSFFKSGFSSLGDIRHSNTRNSL